MANTFQYTPGEKSPIGGGTSAPLFSGAGLLLDLFFSVPGIGGLFRKLFAYATGTAGGTGSGAALVRKVFAYGTSISGALSSGAATYLKHFRYSTGTAGGTSSGAGVIKKVFRYLTGLAGGISSGAALIVKHLAYRPTGGGTGSGLAVLRKKFAYPVFVAGAIAAGAALTKLHSVNVNDPSRNVKGFSWDVYDQVGNFIGNASAMRSICTVPQTSAVTPALDGPGRSEDDLQVQNRLLRVRDDRPQGLGVLD